MNGRIFAVLFTVIFAVGAVPFVLAQPSGSASAWLTGGFMLPIETPYHVPLYIAIGILSSWLAGEAITLVPLSAAIMMSIGVMMQVDPHAFPAMTDFIVGAILLFALSVSMLRNKAFLFCIPPIAVWAYFAGSGYMADVPSVAPLYFLQGMLVSALLMMAIGVCIGITLTEIVHESMQKVRHLPHVTAFISFF